MASAEGSYSVLEGALQHSSAGTSRHPSNLVNFEGENLRMQASKEQANQVTAIAQHAHRQPAHKPAHKQPAADSIYIEAGSV